MTITLYINVKINLFFKTDLTIEQFSTKKYDIRDFTSYRPSFNSLSMKKNIRRTLEGYPSHS